MKNRLPPLSTHMDFEGRKCNTYAKQKVTLQPLSTHMDFQCPKRAIFGRESLTNSLILAGAWFGLVWCLLAWFGVVQGRNRPYIPRPSKDDVSNKLPQMMMMMMMMMLMMIVKFTVVQVA